MGYGVSDARHRINFTEFDGSDNWVDIRAKRTSGAAARIGSVAFVITGVGGDGQPIIRPSEDFLAQMRAQLFHESIVEWSLKADDADSAPMPLSLHTFGYLLDEDTGNWLDQAITAYYQQQKLTDAAKRGAPVGPGGGAPGPRRAA